MATQASPTAQLHPHHLAQARQQPNGHGPLQPPPPPPGPPQGPPLKPSQVLAQQNEQIWIQIGSAAELVGDVEAATNSYERSLHFNPSSIPAMVALSCILRAQDRFPAAIETLQNILRIDPSNGDTWSSLGHCFLMMDDLQQAYSAYQQALYHLPNPKEPKLWYGIGILYDRYGSLEHAEEAFSQVMRMEPSFEKANEIYFRLGIIYKQQQKFSQSLECFKYIVADPPRPLSEEDIWFQIGHVHEQQKDYEAAKAAYTRVLDRDPQHAKVLQQLGWLHHQRSNSFDSQDTAIQYLEKSVSADQADAQSWYLLGRCYMSQQRYPKAYEAYQQAVYRDGRNPTFWCSIGVLYYQINQYRDALDAYSRAIRLNPNISEVWYDLGTLYESCNNQTNDALDAYTRAGELDPNNPHIKARLALLRGQPTDGLSTASAPHPQDIHPQAYQPGALGSLPGPQWPGAASSSQAPPPGPPPPALAPPGDWNRRLADIQTPNQPPLNLHQERERMAPNGTPARQPSPPRAEPPRSVYQDIQRPPPPAHRGLSPSPKVPYGQNGPQDHPAGPATPSMPHQLHQQVQTPSRVANPNFPASGHPLSGSGGAPPHLSGGPPYGPRRVASPASEVRPIVAPGSSAPSPNGFGREPYVQHPHSGPPSITGGAPPPQAAHHVAEMAAREREREERTMPSVPKRHREWEDEPSSKRPANDEARSRREDPALRRSSPPDRAPASPPRAQPEPRLPEPRQHERRQPEPRQPESRQPELRQPELRQPEPRLPEPRQSEPRRPDEHRLPLNGGYHPSEAAHHPPMPAGMHSNDPSPRSVVTKKEPERRDISTPTPIPAVPAPSVQRQPTPRQPTPVQTPHQTYEPAARKMDVDEDYDDSDNDEKKSVKMSGSKRGSPGGNASVNGASVNNGPASTPAAAQQGQQPQPPQQQQQQQQSHQPPPVAAAPEAPAATAES